MNISASYRSHLFQIKSGGVAAFGLLMIYLCGGMGMDFAHQQVHAKAAQELHSVANENDPCHLSLYHNDESRGCNHQSHLLKSDECKVCQLLLHTKYLVPNSISKSLNPQIVTYLIIQNFSVFCEDTHSQFQRGPPHT